MDGARRVGVETLPDHGRLEHPREQRHLPGRALVVAPLPEDLLRPGCASRRRPRRRAPRPRLVERREDRRRGEHRRGDPHAAPGGADALGDAMRELGPASGREPRAHRRAADVDRRGSKSPLPSTPPRVPEVLEVARVRARASPSESTVTSTFSSRVQESRVQLVEPVHTASRVADHVLVVHEVGIPGTPAAARRAARAATAPCAGRRQRRRRGRVGVEGDPHGHAARGRRADRARHGVARARRAGARRTARCRASARLAEESRHALRHLEGGLAPRVQRVKLDHGARDASGRCPMESARGRREPAAIEPLVDRAPGVTARGESRGQLHEALSLDAAPRGEQPPARRPDLGGPAAASSRS